MEHPTLLRTPLGRKKIWTLKLRDGNHHLHLGWIFIGTQQRLHRYLWYLVDLHGATQAFAVLTLSASRKSAVTMRGSTVRRSKLDDRSLHLQSIIWRVGLPVGIQELPCFFFVFRVRMSGHSWKRGGRNPFPGPFDNQTIILLPKPRCLQLFCTSTNKTLVFTTFLFGWVVRCKKWAKHCYLRHIVCQTCAQNIPQIGGSFFHPDTPSVQSGEAENTGFLAVLPLLGVVSQILVQDAKKCRQHAQMHKSYLP